MKYNTFTHMAETKLAPTKILWLKKRKKYLKHCYCTEEQLDQFWFELTHVTLPKIPSSDRERYLEAVLSYMKPQSVRDCTATLEELEEDWMEQQYLLYHDQYLKKPQLATPEETYGTQIKGAKCVHCQSQNTGSSAIQKRSSDEPTSYQHHCRDCSKTWVTRT